MDKGDLFISFLNAELFCPQGRKLSYLIRKLNLASVIKRNVQPVL